MCFQGELAGTPRTPSARPAGANASFAVVIEEEAASDNDDEKEKAEEEQDNGTEATTVITNDIAPLEPPTSTQDANTHIALEIIVPNNKTARSSSHVVKI